MLDNLISRIVRFSVERPWTVLVAALLLSSGSAFYIARHFAINTDVNALLESHEAWAERDTALEQAFPARNALTLVVVAAPSAELANAAADLLAARLASERTLFHSVVQSGAGPFFERNALLYASSADLASMGPRLGAARPLLNALARDPSLRGLANLLSVSLLTPLESGQLTLEDMAPLLDQSAAVVEAALADRAAAFSWQRFAQGETAIHPATSLIEVHPQPNYGDLEAGGDASARIRTLARELELTRRFGASVQLTGPIPLSDEEFASVQEGSGVNAIGMALTVILILWLALRSVKLVVAVFVTLVAGLIVTTALGLLLVGALNMISVAFAVLFVGIGVDFSIQFGVRYRSMRAEADSIVGALERTGRDIALPLTLAAVATAASFLSFLPTAYRGLAELGEIAGAGILLVAFPSALTLFPALVVVLSPRAGTSVPGIPWLAPLDRFFERHRMAVLVSSCAVIVLGLLLLPRLQFDADPLHLKDPHSESMRTLTALSDSSEAGTNDVQVLATSLEDARASAARLRLLPEVRQAVTLSDLVPDDVPQKLPTIEAMAHTLLPVLEQPRAMPAPDGARVTALQGAAAALANAAIEHPGAGSGAATRLGKALDALAHADPAARERAELALAAPLAIALEQLALSFHPEPVTIDSLPADLRGEWITSDGRALVQVAPRLPSLNDPGHEAALRRFCAAVLRVEPRAIGGPISVFASADTIIRAFFVAAAVSLVSIALLLWVTLRRWADVARTLVPLLVSALVTLEICAATGIALNFANIIALPLLLGIGVAFKIYYVIAWRHGQTGFLQSALTQAVVLSAATTATAFGSLWLSHHAGTASMGQLLALSFACTLIGAVLFQPVLMGRAPSPAAPPGAS